MFNFTRTIAFLVVAVLLQCVVSIRMGGKLDFMATSSLGASSGRRLADKKKARLEREPSHSGVSQKVLGVYASTAAMKSRATAPTVSSRQASNKTPKASTNQSSAYTGIKQRIKNNACRVPNILRQHSRSTKDNISKVKNKIEVSGEKIKSKIENFKKNSGSKKKKVLILMSDTGGGHRASAQALDQALSELFPNQFDVKITDIWTDHANFPFNRFVPTYRFLAKNPLLWRGFYAYGAFPPTKLFTEVWSKQNSYGSFKSCIVNANPDVVVSVHPLCQLMPLSIVGEMNKMRDPKLSKIKFVTVVTDLAGAHSTWFDRRVDACFVPSQMVKRLALRNGVTTDKIRERGLPIRPAFWKDAKDGKSKDKLRKELGLHSQAKTVLLMGGGDGVGGLQQITTEVAKKLRNASKMSQLVVICGHNKRVSDTLKAQTWPSNVNVVVRGFCQNIDEYMAASDCLVTKAGPGTIAEAMIRGLPMILSSYLPGQEAGNVPYVTKGGFGVYTGNNPRKIANTVFDLFQDSSKLESMSRKAREMAHPDATRLIAKDIGMMISKQSVVSVNVDSGKEGAK